MKKRLLVVGLMFAGQMGIANASPVTLEFESLTVTGTTTSLFSYGGTMSEDGFTLIGPTALGGFASFRPGSGNFYTGSTMPFSNVSGGVTTLSQDNGNPFSMLGISLAFRTGPAGVTNSLTFTGHKAVGTVTQTFSFVQVTVPPAIPVHNVLFNASFTDLLSVSWIQGPEGHQFDNVVVDGAPSAVPLPAALPLFGTGLALLGFVGWRRKGAA